MPTHTLPADSTSFIGRAKELADLAHVLADPTCQLLTLVGAGGSGKTRLAIQLATQVTGNFPDGVYFIALAPLNSAKDIVPAIANTLGLHLTADRTPEDQLLAYLRPRQLLLVLDNFEHLLEGAGLVANMLAAAPAMKLVVTSREALKLQEEWVRSVIGMRFPDQLQVDHIEDYSAVKLFVERAYRVRGDFSLTDEQTHVIQICQLVEGLPLGIELAAAWLRSLTCEQIADAIRRNVDFLATPLRNAPERHRSMRAVFDQSWKLLNAEEQAVYRKLAVFRGGFEREAAEHVANAPLRTLTGLVDKSLLHVVASGRYDTHELLRQYAEEQLQAANEGEAIRQAHLDYYANFLRQREADLKGARQIEALDEIEANFENVCAAWSLAIRHKDAEAINRSLESLYLFCEMRSRLYEGHELLAQAREQWAVGPHELPHPVWGRIVPRWAQMWRLNQGVPERCEEIRPDVETSLKLARTNGDRGEIAFCLWTLGTLAHTAEDWAQTSAIFEESLAIYTDLADRYYMARAADYLGSAYGPLNPAKFIRFSRQSLELRRRIGDKFGSALSLSNLAEIAMWDGRYAEAEQHLQEIAAILRETGGTAWVSRARAFLALVAFLQGDVERASLMAAEVLEPAPKSTLSGAGFALITLSLVANMDEDYVRARQLCEQCLSAGLYNPASGLSVLVIQGVLALAACGLGEYQVARDHLRSAEQFAAPAGQMVFEALLALLAVALIRAYENQQEQAAELLALAFHHHIFPNSWLQKWPQLTRLYEQLKAELSPEIFTAAWVRGKTSDLIEVATAVLATLQVEPGEAGQGESHMMPDGSARDASSPDPLTERELEVLHWMAAGLSNDEIAVKLFIGVSTVKTHINHLYGKLGVKNRTQAVARARVLNLLSSAST